MDEQEHWHFLSPDFEDTCGPTELHDFHVMFQLSGKPYTVQHFPIVPLSDRDSDDGDSWYASALTPSQRNPRLR